MEPVKITVTAADCERDTFRSGGNGGQNANKRDTGVRFRHLASGAVGESREHRTQLQNERAAWVRLGQHPRMQAWLRVQLAAREQGYQNLGAIIDASMRSENLRIELDVPPRPGDILAQEG